MRERDFCYWLQGYFELMPNGVDVTFDNRQAHIIYKHLDLVKVTGVSQFCEWVRTALDLGCRLQKDGRAAMTLMIRERLAAHFEHVLDKQDDNQQVLQDIHQVPGGPVMRC